MYKRLFYKSLSIKGGFIKEDLLIKKWFMKKKILKSINLRK